MSKKKIWKIRTYDDVLKCFFFFCLIESSKFKDIQFIIILVKIKKLILTFLAAAGRLED